MKKTILKIKQQNLFFIFLNIYIYLLIFIPKRFSTLFGLPIRIILTLTLILIAIYQIKKGKLKTHKINLKYLYIIMGLFILSLIPSVFVSKAKIISLYTIAKFIVVFILLIILTKIEFEKNDYKILLTNFLISTLILNIIGITQYVFKYNIMINNSGINYYPGANGRVYTTFFNTIYYSIFLNLMFPISFYFLIKEKRKSRIIFYTILCTLLYINIVLTFTRSSIIGFFGILIILLVFLNKKIFNYKVFSIIIIIIISSLTIPGAKPLIKKAYKDTAKIAVNILNFLPGFDIKDNSYEDFDKKSTFEDYSLQHREAFARIAKKIANNNLMTGVGIGTYIDYMNSKDFDLKYPEYNLSKTHPHSSIILIFAEAGIMGLITYLILQLTLLIKPYITLTKLYKRSNIKYEINVIIFVITVGFLLINFMSENAFYDTQICYLFITIYGILTSYSVKSN